MSLVNLKIFKLQYSGRAELFEGSSEELYDIFSPVNIIYVYVIGQKRLYVWLGSQISPTLRNNISLFRERFPDNYPDLRVLRYITIDEKGEPWDFFQGTGLSKELLHERIDSYQEKLTPIMAEIKELQERADTLFENEKYSEAIDVANKILEKAIQVDDKPLKKDQEEFIDECEVREKFKTIMGQLQCDKNDLESKIESIQSSRDIDDFHSSTSNFKQKYEEYLDFSKFPEIKDLFEREEKIWNQYEQEKSIQSTIKSLKIDIEELRKKAKEAIEIGDLYMAHDYFDEIIKLLTEHSAA